MQIEPMIDDLQTRSVNLMNNIERLANKNDMLQSVPMSFSSAKKLVAGSEYNVIVCGEVKKGKSSFLNAIIGQDILPVNNEIATSQVFRISNAPKESFFLVFSDGSKQPISREELSRYGSQVDANLKGEPVFKERQLSYIQVNVPISFLPKGVSLVDTPGLGALYKSHEWITQNYVSHANAIIFVLDPESPIGEHEKRFILKALDVTEDIIFVLTKIDLYSPEAWSSILQRNESLLADIYASKGVVMPQVMPVSSMNLMKASTGKIEALKNINLRNSRFPEVKAELFKMMFRGVGILRTGQALKESVEHINRMKSTIEDMLKVCVVDNCAEQQKISKRKERQQELLIQDWGQDSQKRKQIVEEIGTICADATVRVQQMVSLTGPVYKEYEAKINAVSNMEQVNELGKSMGQEIVNDVSSQWQSIAQQIESRVAAVLSGVSAQMGNVGVTNIGGEADNLEIRELTINEKISCWRGAAFFGCIGTTMAAAIGAFAVPIIGSIVGIGIAAVSWLFGCSQTDNTQIDRNKQLFKGKLIELLNELSVKLLYAQNGQSLSVVAQFAHDVNKNANEAIQSLYEKKKIQLQRELEDVERQAKTDLVKRKQAADTWNGLKKELEVLSNEVKQLITLRNTIDQNIKQKI